MPWIAELPSNGLKFCTRLVSGEDSITRVGELELALAVLLPPLLTTEVPLEEDEQAARPAARSVTAPAVSSLLLENLLVVNFDLSSRVMRFEKEFSFVSLVRRRCPSQTGRRRPVASTLPPGWASAAGGRGYPACTCR